MTRVLLNALSLALLALGLSLQCYAFDKPQRIVSLSLCTDQLLLMLVGRERIAGVSHLADEVAYSYQWRKAKGLAQHDGLAEQIIPLQPDLIIGSNYSSGNSVGMLRQLGYEVATNAPPNTLAEAEALTRHIGRLVEEPERAEQLVLQMQRDIARARELVADKPSLVAVSYGPNGFTAGSNTLKNEILEAAGYRNLATELGIEGYGNISLERLVSSNPDIIILDELTANSEQPDQNSRAQSMPQHPVLKKLFADRSLPSLPTSYWICPGPIASKAILKLAEQRL